MSGVQHLIFSYTNFLLNVTKITFVFLFQQRLTKKTDKTHLPVCAAFNVTFLALLLILVYPLTMVLKQQ
jgi:hypothetical protein